MTARTSHLDHQLPAPPPAGHADAPRSQAPTGTVGPAQPRLVDVEVVRGEGAWVETADGRSLLDLTSGIATLNLGHAHPRVVAAARGQLEALTHSGGVFAH